MLTLGYEVYLVSPLTCLTGKHRLAAILWHQYRGINLQVVAIRSRAQVWRALTRNGFTCFSHRCFRLLTLEQHLKVAFSKVLRHTRKNPTNAKDKATTIRLLKGQSSHKGTFFATWWKNKQTKLIQMCFYLFVWLHLQDRMTYMTNRSRIQRIRFVARSNFTTFFSLNGELHSKQIFCGEYFSFYSVCLPSQPRCSPQSVKGRNDAYYMTPEHVVAPNSPMWYSSQPLTSKQVEQTLARILVVREIQEIIGAASES